MNLLYLFFIFHFGFQTANDQISKTSTETSINMSSPHQITPERQLLDIESAYAMVKKFFESSITSYDWFLVEKENHTFHVVRKQNEIDVPIFEAKVKSPYVAVAIKTNRERTLKKQTVKTGLKFNDNDQQKNHIKLTDDGSQTMNIEDNNEQSNDRKLVKNGEEEGGEDDDSTNQTGSKKTSKPQGYQKFVLIITNRPKEDPNKIFAKFHGQNLAFQRDVIEKSPQFLEEFIKKCAQEYQQLLNTYEANSQIKNILEGIKNGFQEIKNIDYTCLGTYQTQNNAGFTVFSEKLNKKYIGTISKVNDDYFKLELQTLGSSVHFYISKKGENNLKQRIKDHFSILPSPTSELITLKDAMTLLDGQIKTDCRTIEAEFKVSGVDNGLLEYHKFSKINEGLKCNFKDSKIFISKVHFGLFQYFHITKEFEEFRAEEVELLNKIEFSRKEILSMNADKSTIKKIIELRKKNIERQINENDIYAKLNESFPNKTEEPIDDILKTEIERQGNYVLKKWKTNDGLFWISVYKSGDKFLVELVKRDPKKKATSSVVINVPYFNSYDSLEILGQQILEFMKV